MLTRLRQRRARGLESVVGEEREFYAQLRDPKAIGEWQLDRFNALWPALTRDVPAYGRLAQAHGLSRGFSSWEEFQAALPVMGRAEIQASCGELISRARPADYQRTTGGSTAEPVQLPAWFSEQVVNTRDVWLARSWFGVTPADKLFLLWGHSHLLGTGLTGRWNGLQRRAKDWLCGYTRWSAYDLSEPALRRAADALVAARPGWVLGYAVALDRFARVNADRRTEFHRLGLKLVVATAEAFPHPASAASLSELFGCSVAMEYGAVETGLLAHQSPAGGYEVLWRHQMLEGRPSAETPGAMELLVTSLFPRCFPLVRYRLGDLVVPAGDAPIAQRFAAVIGRCNDYVIAPDGRAIHSEAFTHAVKECPGLLGYQVVQAADGRICLHYLAPAPLAGPAESDIRRRLQLIHPALTGMAIVRVDTLAQSVAGKTRRVVRHAGANLH